MFITNYLDGVLSAWLKFVDGLGDPVAVGGDAVLVGVGVDGRPDLDDVALDAGGVVPLHSGGAVLVVNHLS